MKKVPCTLFPCPPKVAADSLGQNPNQETDCGPVCVALGYLLSVCVQVATTAVDTELSHLPPQSPHVYPSMVMPAHPATAKPWQPLMCPLSL